MYVLGTIYVPGPCRSQKKVAGPLVQELQIIVSHHVDNGD